MRKKAPAVAKSVADRYTVCCQWHKFKPPILKCQLVGWAEYGKCGLVQTVLIWWQLRESEISRCSAIRDSSTGDAAHVTNDSRVQCGLIDKIEPTKRFCLDRRGLAGARRSGTGSDGSQSELARRDSQRGMHGPMKPLKDLS